MKYKFLIIFILGMVTVWWDFWSVKKGYRKLFDIDLDGDE